MEEQRQTHTLPAAEPALGRIARLMGYSETPAFQEALARQMNGVRSIYERIFGTPGAPDDSPERSSLPGEFSSTDASAWTSLLARRGFREPDKARDRSAGSSKVPVSSMSPPVPGNSDGASSRVFSSFVPTPEAESSLAKASSLGPARIVVDSFRDRVLARLDSYISAYGARSSLYELWTARARLDHLLALFDRSEFLAELAIRVPDLVDELESGGHLRRQKSAEQTLADLRHGRDDEDQDVLDSAVLPDGVHAPRPARHSRVGGISKPPTGNSPRWPRPAWNTLSRSSPVETGSAITVRGDRAGQVRWLGTRRRLRPGRDLRRTRHDKEFAPAAKDRGTDGGIATTRTEHGAVFELDARLRPDGEKRPVGERARLLRGLLSPARLAVGDSGPHARAMCRRTFRRRAGRS